MSEGSLETTDLKAQYLAQVSADLERNAKEQDRIGAETAALQEQLDALQQDRAVLMSMEQALRGAGATPAEKTEVGDATAAPQQATAPRTSPRKKATAKRRKSTAAEVAPPKAATKATTLGELILDHLAQQAEPRSAAEVTTALAESHPDRKAKGKVVRMALESLVAKGRVDRTKQNRSVFYSVTDTAQDAPAAPDTSADATGEDSAP